MMQQRIDLAALARKVLSRGSSQRWLANEMGVSQPTVSRLLQGRHKNLRAEATLKLIQIAGGCVHFSPPEAKDKPVDQA